MRPGRLLALLGLLLATLSFSAAPALAQGTNPLDQLPSDAQKALQDLLAGTNPDAATATDGGATTDGSVPSADGGGTPPGATTPDDGAPAPDDAESPTQIAPTSPAPAADAGSNTVPGPPPYLTAGQDAQVQPVSSVSRLTEPDVPLEPVRLAALGALLLACLLLAAAVVLRSLGVRTAAPVVVTPALGDQLVTAGPLARLRGRAGLLFDDVRDFLRRSR